MQLVTGIDDALLERRRELMRAQGRRRLIALAVVLGVLGVLAGYKLLEMSSAFTVDSVTVTGAPPDLARRIETAVQASAGGGSLLSVDRGAIAAQVARYPQVRSVSVDRAFPHTLALTVHVERPAVVAHADGRAYLISSRARVIGIAPGAAARLPALDLGSASSLTVGQTSGDPNLSAALAVLVHLPAGFRSQVGRITALSAHDGVVMATVGRHIELRLGPPEALGLKLQVVERVMRRITGAQRAQLSYLDVSAPARPAIGLRATSVSTSG